MVRCSGRSRRNARSSWSRSATQLDASLDGRWRGGSAGSRRRSADVRAQGQRRRSPQAVRPCVETLWITKRGESSPGADERLLDGILCEIRIPQDQPGDRVQTRRGHRRERLEGVVIPVPRCHHKISLHPLASWHRHVERYPHGTTWMACLRVRISSTVDGSERPRDDHGACGRLLPAQHRVHHPRHFPLPLLRWASLALAVRPSTLLRDCFRGEDANEAGRPAVDEHSSGCVAETRDFTHDQVAERQGVPRGRDFHIDCAVEVRFPPRLRWSE